MNRSHLFSSLLLAAGIGHGVAIQAQVLSGDHIVEGHFCIGDSDQCDNPESYPNLNSLNNADVLIKDDFPSIYLMDTSLNEVDWQIAVDYESNGTPNQAFMIGNMDDPGNSATRRFPFIIEPDAPTNQLYLDSMGDVGIGTATPDYELEVERFATEPHIVIHNSGSNGGATFRMIDDLSGADFKFKATQLGGFKIRDHGNSQDVITIEAQSAAAHAIHVDSNGNVGIGATTQNVATALSVNGIIEARDITLTNSSISWPDYVFDDAYELRPLGEVEAFIAENRHLPGVPSEREIEDNGIDLGEVVTVQMEKIEELTLYLIALQKENEALRHRFQQENDELRQRVQALELN